MDGRATAWERVTRIDVRIWDGLLATLAIANAQLDLWYAYEPRPAAQPDLLASALLLVATAPLYLRRKRPLATAAVVSAAIVAFGWFQHPSTEVIFSLVIAAYSIASYRPRSPRQALALIALVVASGVSQADAHPNWVETASNAILAVGIPFGIGRIVWNRRRRLERERDQAARDAVALERSRIARELHDVVAHAMSVMVVQAGAARAVLRRDPEQTERALISIEESGRTGLAEMRRLLSAEGDGGASLAPQPGLEQLDELLARMRATGLDVELVTEGEARPMEAGVDLSVYRIVQEGLTNALRHGGDDVHARVLLRYHPDGLGVEISDDGRGPSGEADGSGRGLVGMRERVAFLGGEIAIGARPGGGFLVEVQYPDAGGGTFALMSIRVLIADDQALMRGGFRMILDAEDDIEVVGEAIDGADAIRQYAKLGPDVVVMDVRMPTMDGIESTRRLTAADHPARVLILTTFDLDEYVYEALRAGASGFLLKDRPPEELVAAVRVVAAGDALLAPSVTRRLVEEFAKRPGPAPPPVALEELTEREREVLVCMARGRSNKEIARELFVAETTVKTHVGRVLQKLGLRDRAQAVVLAYESGLVQPGSA